MAVIVWRLPILIRLWPLLLVVTQVRELLLKKKEKVILLLKGLCAKVPRKAMLAVTSRFQEVEKVSGSWVGVAVSAVNFDTSCLLVEHQ